ncbi:uncharacterized protein AKAME5_001934000 [Lates japonicus]|uniref:Uncharacterized protein n=1 Tax=Lates japonicus TaxID=270547 RepID=A0AAD3N923_LATJO|nr:uncharacterized protein AKAME5_001934000 [Lates japonicus]
MTDVDCRGVVAVVPDTVGWLEKSVSGTVDAIEEAKLGITVIELVCVSAETGETDGSPVTDGDIAVEAIVLSKDEDVPVTDEVDVNMSRVWPLNLFIHCDIAVEAIVLSKDEDVPLTEEVDVNMSGVWSVEPSSIYCRDDRCFCLITQDSVVPGDIAVEAIVLSKDEDVPLTEEVDVNMSGVWSVEPSSSTVGMTEDVSVSSFLERLSVVPGDIAVEAIVLSKDEDVPVTEEVDVNMSGV